MVRSPAESAVDGAATEGLDARLPWLTLVWLSSALVLLVAMAEIGRLSGSVLDTRSQAWTFGELMGPSAWPSRLGWSAHFAPGSIRPAALRTYLVLDAVFIGLYLVGLLRILGHRYRRGTRRGLLIMVGVLVAVDLAEDVLAWGTSLTPAASGTAAVLAVISTVKCGLGVIAGLAAAYGVLTRGRGLRANLRMIYEVVRKHRLSLVPLVIIAVVAVAPGAEILDQVPDVERRWADTPRNAVVEGLPALVALLAMSLGLLLLGRARTHLAARTCPAATKPRSADPAGPGEPAPADFPLRLWLVGPGLLAGVALVLWLLGAPVAWARVGLFCLLPVGVYAASRYYRWRSQQEPPLWRAVTPRGWPQPSLQLLLRVGDGLALGVLLVGALGAVRSMTAVVVLQAFGLAPGNLLAWAIIVLGALGAPGVWVLSAVAYRVLDRAAKRWPELPDGRLATWLTPHCGDPDPRMLRRFPGWALGAALVLFALVGMLPAWFAQLGVLAVFVLSLLALTGIVAGAGVIAQRYRTPELFQRFRLRSTPVLTLLLVAVLFAGTVGTSTPIHTVRSQSLLRAARQPVAPVEAADPRPELGAAVEAWADRQSGAGCGRPVTVGTASLDVLPMVLIAAEGGGIRAAYWTVQAVQPLRAKACANQATLFSSGVSGGAVGLAVARYNQSSTDVVRAISNSRALSFGLIGLFVRDFAYAAMGIPLPDLNSRQPLAWVDRAGLMEDAWNSASTAPDSWRDRAFVAGPGAPAGALQLSVGPVILNSMSVGNACRVWVSELRLRSDRDDVADGGGGKISCEQSGVAGVRSIDLLSAYGAAAAPDAAAGVVGSRAGEPYSGCLFGLSASTAAMLAARFPYVTPSGGVGPCVREGHPTAPVDQLVDGGYLENTGLGTINDLSDVWLPAVQAWNAAHRSAARPQVIVPMIVYLGNDSGTDRRAPQRDLTGEALLPALAKLRAGSGAVTDDTTLQRSADLIAADRVCPPADPACVGAVESVTRRAFLVYPGSKPQIAAPLGWILSESSRRSMDSAIADQEAAGCQNSTRTLQVDVVCNRGFGTLRDLLTVLGS